MTIFFFRSWLPVVVEPRWCVVGCLVGCGDVLLGNGLDVCNSSLRLKGLDYASSHFSILTWFVLSLLSGHPR